MGSVGLVIGRDTYDELRSAGASNALQGASFVSTTQGWAAGSNGTGIVLVTTDGGLSWSPQTAPAGNNLRATWFPDTLPEEELTSETDVKWIGLDIKKHQHASGSDEATVEFVARFKVGGKAHRLHEISNFVRQPDDSGQARWYYVDGRFPED